MSSSIDEKASQDDSLQKSDAVELPQSPAERALVRKLDRVILPITCLLYLFSYLDRSNLGNARLQGLPKDLLDGDPTGKKFDWVNSIFFFSYILVQVPATITAKLFPPRVWMACAAVGWGVTSTLMSTAFNQGSIMAARFVLGIFEACFGPAIPIYFSLYYTKQEMGLRMAYWLGFAAVAGAFGGAIAYGVQLDHLPFSNWRLLFIAEGIPAVLLGLVTYLILPNRPESTKYLNEDERKLAVERMNRGTSGDVGATFTKAHIYMALKDWKVYAGGVIYFGLNSALASTSAFLPTIIVTFGYTNARAQLLTVPPYAVAFVVIVLLSYISDRVQVRGLFVCGASTLGAIGYILLLTVHHNEHVRYFATFCITSGTYTAIGVTIAWFSHNLGSETKKSTGIPLFMAIGQCGSVLGSHLYPKTEGPRYIKGFAVSCALEFVSALVALILYIAYKRENARRNRVHGVPAPNATVDTHELADKAPNFRYIA